MKISEALRQLIENPDDMTNLPQLVAKVEELETKVESFHEVEQSYQERINKLQEINRNYLAQIPIPSDQNQEQESEEHEVTFEQAQQELIKAMQNIGGKN